MLITFLTSCCTIPVDNPPVTYNRPVAPGIPNTKFVDIPGYYGIDENTTEFDDLINFMIEYKAYVRKVEKTFNKYDQLE